MVTAGGPWAGRGDIRHCRGGSPSPAPTPTADLGDAAPRRRGGALTSQTWVEPPAQTGSCWWEKHLRLLLRPPTSDKNTDSQTSQGQHAKGRLKVPSHTAAGAEVGWGWTHATHADREEPAQLSGRRLQTLPQAGFKVIVGFIVRAAPVSPACVLSPSGRSAGCCVATTRGTVTRPAARHRLRAPGALEGGQPLPTPRVWRPAGVPSCEPHHRVQCPCEKTIPCFTTAFLPGPTQPRGTPRFLQSPTFSSRPPASR